MSEMTEKQLDAPASEQKPVWEPIATAPRDNKRPLYLARINENGELLEIDFDGGWEFWQESYEMPHVCGWDWCSANGIEEPTHWAFQDAPLPPAPQPDYKAQRDINIEAIDNAIAEALGEAYDCTRVWSAWSYGTMGPDDFQLVSEDPSRIAEIRDAILASVKGGA